MENAEQNMEFHIVRAGTSGRFSHGDIETTAQEEENKKEEWGQVEEATENSE